MLAPGEDDVYGDSFLVSIAVPYVKTQLMCSNTRFVFKTPPYPAGLIPVGVEENSFPMHGISVVSSSFRFRIGQFLLALLPGLVGFLFLSDKSLYGVPIVLCAILALLSALPRELLVQNHAGAYTAIRVSVLESGRLKIFTRELQNRVFANQDQIHHEEAQAVRTQQVMLQQLALQQQMGTQQQALAFQQQAMGAPQGGQPPAQTPADYPAQPPSAPAGPYPTTAPTAPMPFSASEAPSAPSAAPPQSSAPPAGRPAASPGEEDGGASGPPPRPEY